MECCFRRDRIPRTYQIVLAQTLVYEACTERLCSNCCFFIEKPFKHRNAVVIYACWACFHLLLLILIAISVCYQMACEISLCAGFLNSHFELQIISQAICICLGHSRAIVLCAFLQHLQMYGFTSVIPPVQAKGIFPNSFWLKVKTASNPLEDAERQVWV